jgi:DNA-binding transcriptional MerR regulator
VSKAADAFRTISEVADELDVPKHVLRFWENRFPQLRPMKRGGGRRYYRPADLQLLRGIRHLLHSEGYTIKGVQKILREHGVDDVKKWGRTESESGPPRRDAAGGIPRPSPKTLRAASGKAAAGASEGDTRTIVGTAIKELEACRELLTASGKSSTSRAEKSGRTG